MSIQQLAPRFVAPKHKRYKGLYHHFAKSNKWYYVADVTPHVWVLFTVNLIDGEFCRDFKKNNLCRGDLDARRFADNPFEVK